MQRSNLLRRAFITERLAVRMMIRVPLARIPLLTTAHRKSGLLGEIYLDVPKIRIIIAGH